MTGGGCRQHPFSRLFPFLSSLVIPIVAASYNARELIGSLQCGQIEALFPASWTVVQDDIATLLGAMLFIIQEDTLLR